MITFTAMTSEDAHALQSGGLDANGQLPERAISSGVGMPCRHCLTDVAEGEAMLVLSFRPFPAPQPYAELGPVFLHARGCVPHVGTSALPAMLRSPQYIVRGYGQDHRIVYGTGAVVATDDIPACAERLLERDDIAYVHVRSASNNCYLCRIDRA